jgi:CubicO group peptidase (beta-lactamase class C family)
MMSFVQQKSTEEFAMFTKNTIRPIVLFVGVLVLALSKPAVAKTQNTLDVATIDAYIENHIAEHKIPGVALAIVHNGEIVYTQGYGVAGPDGTPVTPQTPFIIGSTSKSFTALAIMQLVAAGEIELDATIQTYLPWFTMADPEQAKLITVRHLLTHSSGLSELDGDKDLANPDVSEEALETHIRELADYNLSRPVGESFEYANTGYGILGLIVQTVSGQSFEDYIEAHIFSPLEMSNSYTSKVEAEANGLSAGHTYIFGTPRVNADAPYARRHMAAGFLISSAEDLGHYLIAQLNGGRYGDTQLLSPEYVALMHQPAIETGTEGTSYAFGWYEVLVEGELSIRHSGNTSNFHSNIALSPARGWGVAIVMNASGAAQLAALNEPINELFRMVSGYEAGQPIEDSASALLVVEGITILSAGLYLVIGANFYRRHRNKGSQLRLMRHLLLPLGIGLVLVWIILSLVPSIFPSNLPILLVFAPDLAWILLVSAGVILLTIFLRLGVYLRSASAR